MINGIDIFKETFSKFKGMYTLIGGLASYLLMDDAGLDFRVTKDFDIVLIIEKITPEFCKAIWDFVKSGGYQIREKGNGKPEFYRFLNPDNKEYPRELEFFSRKNDALLYKDNDRLTPIRISDNISSLSAILLDDMYYDFLTNGLILIDGIQVLNYTHIIPFKAKAWLDLKGRKENGEKVDANNINKHKRDVFRLAQLLSSNDKIVLCDKIKEDMHKFISYMQDDGINLKDINVNASKEELLQLLATVYFDI